MTDVLTRLTAALTDRYAIQRELGAGGMATVYLAHDIKHDRDVAIKVLHPDLGAALGGERFLSEIRTTARLQHPHILPLLDSGNADGLLYYVMPLVTGETLLAGAYLYRALAAKDAFQQKQMTIGGQRIEAGERFRALMAVAALTEKQAWFLLEPYLTEQAARLVIEHVGNVLHRQDRIFWFAARGRLPSNWCRIWRIISVFLAGEVSTSPRVQQKSMTAVPTLAYAPLASENPRRAL